ncbi:MAG: hypothetical protein H7Y10_10675 [Flavobacterium sp.]|nr:hypothetical protein [Flavobacterium sp.]
MFKITRIFNDNRGDSHFEELNVTLTCAGEIGFISNTEKVKGIIFREVMPTYNYDFHTAPQKQYIILLDGGVEIETSLGERRTFNTGDVLLVEDIIGKGHKTKNIEVKPRKSIFVTIE